ncbi:MAG TPA: hypothetical protein VG826_06035 [Pirellulales bacterium]|nr:hypothetical protein [Pirellulales bacterium]
MRIPGWVLCCAFCFAAAAGPAWASPPWQKMALFKQVEADPDKDYRLTEDHGPWLIMAITFSGDEAEQQADELVHELRSRYKLRAYRYEMDFDFSKGEIGRRVDQYGQPVKMIYRVKEIREVAVMVGDFRSVDDAEAQQVLKKLRSIRPECLDANKRLKEGKKDYRTLGSLRWAQEEVNKLMDKNHKPRGPMRHAMIATNPLLPDDYFKPKGLDPLVITMNEQVKYSLLKCPGRYTCKIATFSGNVTVDQALIDDIVKNNKKFQTRLEDAAANAHEMTMALRAKGYEAWEFHDRYASIVTVGSFDSVGTPRPDGQTEINPQLHKLMETFSAPKQTVSGQAAPKIGDPFVVQTKLGKIACDIQAMPVEVPKRSLSRDYERPAVSLR